MTPRNLLVLVLGAAAVVGLSLAPACAHKQATGPQTCAILPAGDGGYVVHCR